MFLPGIWRSRLEEEVLAKRNDGRPQSVMSYSICRRQHKMEHTGRGCHFTCLGAPCNTDKDEGKRMAGFLKQQILKTESLEVNTRKAAGSLVGLGWAAKHSIHNSGLPCAHLRTIRVGICLCTPEQVHWDKTLNFLEKLLSPRKGDICGTYITQEPCLGLSCDSEGNLYTNLLWGLNPQESYAPVTEPARHLGHQHFLKPLEEF
ncbi:uncharacterized protein LOC111095876 isoform X1 [Canis lupus familiaris]|uniref:uncharacterized protein LOC111095876 isoform X1 n=1 Tax=Canis lupus familiaris TaxID=9615 RepID=UPI000BAA1002|nr:uncharacterized protein LOC111095876 isoform X1 [Canis lupus familiaris]XP_022274221.1 uncharacterized protein LOC111095876 isoform X1 [Canis lupus familiaris]XP_022274227.1 uncharacterized protein LOC111095876 isoform X1 [Canis lupus familiaris]XP_022274230.1 uncharacterized protein LOC111095876 isoform X1 [Canis lupus familiaris]XP_022274234.1 uncharacterized protein LOC111095876 isoform X1 [Canis lupus familiaris]XP_022274240.1 uncharacterized protein LOC111095876 isoform X1 [Canis lupus|eukprot:XP_022274215.1 uncharacterized protein LOC111095876 isoform X1 [Canis lupus familiaris]